MYSYLIMHIFVKKHYVHPIFLGITKEFDGWSGIIRGTHRS